jgi:hypothetical protein
VDGPKQIFEGLLHGGGLRDPVGGLLHLLRALAVRDVPGGDDDGPDGRVVETVHADGFEVSPLSVLTAGAALQALRVTGPLHQVHEQIANPRKVIGMDQVVDGASDVFPG